MVSCGVELVSPIRFGRIQQAPYLGSPCGLTTRASYNFFEGLSAAGSQKSAASPLTVTWDQDIQVTQGGKFKQEVPFSKVWFRFKGVPFPIHGSVLRHVARNKFHAAMENFENQSITLHKDGSSDTIRSITIGPEVKRYGEEFELEEGTATVKLVKDGDHECPLAWVDQDYRYFCERVCVDGVPVDTLHQRELNKLAQKVASREMVVVIFQGWYGTELLFQTKEVGYPDLTEAIQHEGVLPTRESLPIFFQIKTSAYDKHPFIQGSFIDKEQLNLAEKVLLGGWTEEELPGEDPEELLAWIQRKLTSKEGIATIQIGKGAPFLVIQPRKQEQALFYCIEDPATPIRTFPLSQVTLPASGAPA